MIISSIYRCEYCGKEYLNRTECVECEASHGHNIILHKKLENILKNNNIFYQFQKNIQMLFIYKVKNICYDSEKYGSECLLEVQELDIKLNALFDWHAFRVNDVYRAQYFVNNIDSENWKPLENNDTSAAFKEILSVINEKSKIENDLKQDEVMLKYNSLASNNYDPALNIFLEMFNSREDLDKTLIEIKSEIKGENNDRK